MIIIEDTRNQPGKHKNINAYMEKCGHKVVRSKMRNPSSFSCRETAVLSAGWEIKSLLAAFVMLCSSYTV